MISQQLLNPARQPGESFDAYKRRRATGNRTVKRHLKGRLAHNSSSPVMVEDTFDNRMQVVAGNLRRPVYFVTQQGLKMIAGQTRGVTYRAPTWPVGMRKKEYRRLKREGVI